MNQKRLITLFICLPFILLSLTTGCREESGSQQEACTPLRIASVSTKAEVIVSAQTSSVSNAAVSSALQALRSSSFSDTYTALRSGTESGDIGVYCVGTTDYAAQSNVKYTGTSGTWTVADGVTPIYLYSATASVCAYSPYSATIGDGPTAIPLTSQLYNADKDLCYAKSVTYSSAKPNVNFTMDHAYAKMTFTINHDASYSGACKIEGITIANPGIRSSNTLDITSGTYGSSIAASGSVTVNPGISSITSGSSTPAEATVLMVPTITGTTAETLTGNMTFLFTVDGNIHAATLPVSSNNLTTLAAGSNYQISVNISGSGLSVSLGSSSGSGSSVMGAMANCYIVAPGASITIPVNIKGNGGDVAGTGLSTTHTAASVGIIWQTATDPSLITYTFDAASQTATITAGSTPTTGGNAVIAAYSGASQTGDILWSWHIWVTSYNPNAGTLYRFNTNNLLTFMDRNLGATGTTANTTGVMGLLYQWGRKDPFPGADVTYYYANSSWYYGYSSLAIYNALGTKLTESTQSGGTGINSYVASATTADTKTLNLTNSIKNPMNFYFGVYGANIGYDWYTTTNDQSYQNNALWGGANTRIPTSKTIFDPCPAGWRVPPWQGVETPENSLYSPWGSFGTTNIDNSDYVPIGDSGGTWSSYGITWTSAGFYPAAGYRGAGSGALYNVGGGGDYWSASAYGGYGFRLYFNSGNVYPASYYSRAFGFSVRCVQEF